MHQIFKEPTWIFIGAVSKAFRLLLKGISSSSHSKENEMAAHLDLSDEMEQRIRQNLITLRRHHDLINKAGNILTKY